MEELVQEAIKAREKAYAPYSRYKVGAALRGKSGIIYTRCNIENASFGATICAERTVAVKAVSAGETQFDALAIVVAGLKDYFPGFFTSKDIAEGRE